jgi:hypothetical protein
VKAGIQYSTRELFGSSLVLDRPLEPALAQAGADDDAEWDGEADESR